MKNIASIVLLIIVVVSGFFLLSSRFSFFPLRTFVVVSGSMRPTLPVGSVVFSLKQSSYQKGEIISFTQGNEVVTHRIAADKFVNGETMFTTKGDANKTADLSPVSPKNVIGKELFMVPLIGYGLQFLKTLPGFLLSVILPAIILIMLEIFAIKDEISKEIDKKAAEKIQSLT